MKKVKWFSGKRPVLCSIAAIVIILFILDGVGVLTGWIIGGTDIYVRMLIQEAVGVLAAWGMLYLTGLVPVLFNRGSGIGRGLLAGMYLLIVSVYSLVFYLLLYEGERVLKPWYLIGAYLLCMLCVGMVEEFVFRGIVATLMLRKFGMSRGGIWKAVALSGLLFGCAHISNILVASPMGVFVQVAVASMLGMILASIYFRSGCIWVTVLLHAFIDIAAAITTGLYSGTMADAISSYSPIQLISCVIYLIVVAVLLRKKKLADVEKNMGPLLGRGE